MKYFFELKSETEIKERNNLDFPAHLHEEIELGYIEKGSVVLILDENKYQLNEGNFFVVFPNQIHSYEKSKNIKAKIIIFSHDLIIDHKNLFFSKIPQTPVINESDNGKKIIHLMFDIITDNLNVLKGFLNSIFWILMDEVKFKDINKYNVSTLKNILIYCSEHFYEGISISDVAENLHISRYHISHIFKQKLNVTFSEYITRKRISYACNLLCNKNLSIIDVAYQSGFNSLRSFNRNFFKHMHTSPKEYRKMK